MPVDADAEWLTATELADLRQRGARRRIPAGGYLFLEGDEPSEVLLVDSGTVKVTTSTSDGSELVLAIVGADELLGELSAIDGSARSASATALDDVEVHAVPNDAFRSFIADHPQVNVAFARMLVTRLRQSNRRQLEYANVDAIGRLCARLDELRTRQRLPDTAGVVLEMRLNQTELAQWAGLSREAVVKALRKLRTLRWIETGPGTVTLLDPGSVRDRGML